MRVLKQVLFVIFVSSGSFVCAQELMLFGGSGHDVFLGCLNCSEFNSGSVCNEFGSGSSFETNSIFNEFGAFGSEFSSSSPWNEFSTSDDVPVLVDERGAFYGYFTINQSRSDAVSFAHSIAEIYMAADGDLELVRKLLCRAIAK